MICFIPLNCGMDADKKYLTTREASELAKELGFEITQNLIRTWVFREKLNASKIFGRVLIEEEYFKNWLLHEREDLRKYNRGGGKAPEKDHNPSEE